MTLPFLSERDNREVIHRIERDREPEEKRYQARKAEITADLRERGLYNSTIHVANLREEEIHHLRQVSRISRDAIFEIIEDRDIKLSDSDLSTITDQLRKGFKHAANEVTQRLSALERQIGLPASTSQRHAIEDLIEEALYRETVTEVSIRAGDLQRKQDRRAKLKRSERIGKLFWTVFGAAIGIAGTLLTKWLLRQPD